MKIITIVKKVTPLTVFLDVDKSKCGEKSPIEKSEIKFIENKSDKKICPEIDKLNESVYNLSNYLQFSKDIDEMKKENLVKNDIQRKLGLKSQWLSTKYSSTGNLNNSISIQPKKVKNKFNCKNGGNRNKNFSFSAECLKNKDSPDADEKSLRQNLAPFKGSVPLMDINTMRYKSSDELTFGSKTPATDVKISENEDSEKPKTEKNSRKQIELRNTIYKVKDAQAKYVEPKTSTDPAKRDLTRFFPPTHKTIPSSKLMGIQKELKDIDLSKYFLPSPVQELRSIPSPGNSPQLIRKTMPKDKHKPDRTISGSSKTLKISTSQVESGLEPMLRDHHVRTEPNKRLSDKINEFACNSSMTSEEYVQLVKSLKTPTEDIDDMFEEVAAALCEAPTNLENRFPQNNKSEIIDPLMVMPELEVTSVLPKAPQRHKKLLSAHTACDDAILSKLSPKLLKEIYEMEKHLQTDGKSSAEGQIAKKNGIELENRGRNAQVDTQSAEKTTKLNFAHELPQRKQLTSNISQSKLTSCHEPIFYNKNVTEEDYSKENDTITRDHRSSSSNSQEKFTAENNGIQVGAYDSRCDSSMAKGMNQMDDINYREDESSTDYLKIKRDIEHEFEKQHSYDLQIPVLISEQQQQTGISNFPSRTPLAQKENHINDTKNAKDCEIPHEILNKRQETLQEVNSSFGTVSPNKNIAEMLNSESNVRKAHIPKQAQTVISSVNDPSCSKLVSIHMESMPSRPLRTKKNDPTEFLIERSQLIHNRKQEFMNEKLFGNNPYLKKSLVQHSGENMNKSNQRNYGHDNLMPTVEAAENKLRTEKSDLERRENKKEMANNLLILDTITPATTNLNVFDLFKRNSANNSKQSPNGKDGCIVS